MAILATEHLTRRFGELTAVDDLSISVEEGEIFGLLGPNGAGKSTAIKMIITLLPPSSGRVTVGGFDLAHNASQIRRLIGYVPQILSADGTLTARENLMVFAKLYDIPRSERSTRIAESLALMELTDASDKLVKNFSGGMIRRLEIAQSMLHRPKVLFLDEPPIGLDPVGRKTVWDHIQKLRNSFGTTIFLTTHYMEEADKLCSRVAIMHLGKLAVIGVPADLKRSLNVEEATLEDVFTHYTGGLLDRGDNYREARSTRRTAKRLG
ncbi:MAG TPA: ATP-binding cassette domain-containing protein [Candidatus Bathyarchaeia archaeon]|nr:ATP-binding cassette domain-containing protein [Candidatus Bathyarchaeia archaeon]